jgi:hypothetical protein
MPNRNGSKFVSRVQDLGQDELECHAYGHAWTPGVPVRDYDKKTDTTIAVQELTCARCPMVRTDFLHHATMVKVRRSHYSEPPRYRVLQKTARGTKDYRREAMLRQLRAARRR